MQMSEDCLSLNVYVPRGRPGGSGFAVMVFIHGGDFLSYSGSSPLFNGDVFVKKGNVILVTLNYRLGMYIFILVCPYLFLCFPSPVRPESLF